MATANKTMNEHEDLPWLAFRYVAGELDYQQREAFETRLATDQSAREAVARAHELGDCVVAVNGQVGDRTVLLVEATSLAETISLADPALATTAALPAAPAAGLQGWVRVGIVATFGTAIGLLLVVGGMRLMRSGSDSDGSLPGDATAVTAELATIWDETREPLDQPLWTDAQDEVDDTLVLESVSNTVDERSSSWVQAAVFGMAGKGDASEGELERFDTPESSGTL